MKVIHVTKWFQGVFSINTARIIVCNITSREATSDSLGNFEISRVCDLCQIPEETMLLFVYNTSLRNLKFGNLSTEASVFDK